jgi:hypothetical protein
MVETSNKEISDKLVVDVSLGENKEGVCKGVDESILDDDGGVYIGEKCGTGRGEGIRWMVMRRLFFSRYTMVRIRNTQMMQETMTAEKMGKIPNKNIS